MHDTLPLLAVTEFPPIRRRRLETLQVNLGYKCNQSWLHCHVNAGPNRTEMMDAEHVALVMEVLQARRIETLDLTGGAPELSPHFRDLVRGARALGVKVIDRCNLTILSEPGQDDLAAFLASEGVEITASLPCYSPANVDRRSLDDIEHGLLRQRGVYDEPRVHFAVNCASIGCPMLREEAFVADRLEAQLAQQAERFMADRTRNRWNARRQRLEMSNIFHWYGDDFRLGHRGIHSVEAFAALHAERLGDTPAEHDRIRSEKVDLAFLDYDWALNDARGEAR